MAKETITRLIDDLDGGQASETVKFALDGREYEIDLSTKNATRLRDGLAPYVNHGVRSTAQRQRGGVTRPPSAPRQNAHDNDAIRAWAAKNRITVAPRGRIATSVLERYYAANGAAGSRPATKRTTALAGAKGTAKQRRELEATMRAWVAKATGATYDGPMTDEIVAAYDAQDVKLVRGLVLASAR